jgi:hypothetical protein
MQDALHAAETRYTKKGRVTSVRDALQEEEARDTKKTRVTGTGDV